MLLFSGKKSIPHSIIGGPTLRILMNTVGLTSYNINIANRVSDHKRFACYV